MLRCKVPGHWDPKIWVLPQALPLTSLMTCSHSLHLRNNGLGQCLLALFYFIVFYFILFYFMLLGPHWRHMEVPRPGVESEMKLPAYATATATTYTSEPELIATLNCDTLKAELPHWEWRKGPRNHSTHLCSRIRPPSSFTNFPRCQYIFIPNTYS